MKTFYKNILYRYLALGFFLLALPSNLSAQTITKETSSSVSGTVCPVSVTEYSVSIPNNFGECKIKWSASNGTIDGRDDLQTVKIKWSDTPGASGTVSVAFSDCGNGNPNEGAGDSKTELILSIKNQSWGSYTSSYNLDYCTTPYVDIFMPPMNVIGTGGVGQPPRVEAAYKWTLPDGWRYQATGQTGTFGTPQPNIRIEPIGCAKPGNVTVRGTLVGAGPFCGSAAESSTATITLNGANPVVTVGPQAGYTGGSACNTTPVTFYATTSVALGCISGYSWQYPQSWNFVSQTGNSITLEPSGTQADANAIKATISFDCGSTVESAAFVPPFSLPLIVGPSLICSNATISLQNAEGLAVNWVSSNTNLLTINSFGQATRVGSAWGEITISASLQCDDVAIEDKKLWVGQPYPDNSKS